MRRIWIVFVCFTVFYTAIAVRLFYWQVLASDTMKDVAASQHFLRFTLPATRGDVISSDGYPFVMNQNAFLVYGEPKKIQSIDTFSRLISEPLTLPIASISAMLSIPDRVWVPIKHKVEEQIVNTLRGFNLTGLGFEKEPKRFYPEASSAAYLLGFVGSDDLGEDRGYFGLEGFYDRELKGKPGNIAIEKDVTGAPILIGETTRIEPKNGRSLHLWIDRSVQRIVEARLKSGVEKYGAKSGNVIVMNPWTGGILAMASYPSYDPRSYTQFSKDEFRNPIVADSYEPGSTFKVLIMASALDKGVLRPETTYEETGPAIVSGYSIRTWNNQYRGTSTMTEALIHSSNVGMVEVSKKLGRKSLIDAVANFGFGTLTNIDLQDEATPDIRSSEEWKEIDVATASFGQGIAVTPIQMVRAVGALANGGMLMEPHVVQYIIDDTGKRTEILPKKIRRVISEKAASDITKMMIASVEEGEAKWAKPKGYSIAGKTGTAQIPVSGHYDDTKTIASFVGFAPTDKPKFVMLVTLRETSSSQWGSETAAPLFFDIAKDIFLYYGISGN